MANIRIVPPSGDTTGTADRAAIQAAIDAVSSSINGMVVLSGGQYYINATLTVNTRATHSTTAGVLINGLGMSRIDVASGMTGTYAIEYYGVRGAGCNARISGIMLDCNYRCRGILFYYQAYMGLLEDSYILASNQIGIDAVDCWGSRITGVVVGYARGIGIRGHRSNQFSLTNCKMYGTGCRSTTSSENAALWVYDCLNGRDAAIAYYDGTDGRGTYTEDWPAVDDTTVTDGTDAYVRTTAEQRAGVVLAGNEVGILDLNLEESAYCSYPAIYFSGSNMSAHLIRMETTYNGPAMFIVEGGTSQGRNVVFTQVHFRNDALLGAGGKRSVVAARSRSVGLRVADSQLRGFAGPIIYAETGDHTQASAERLYTMANAIEPASYLGAAEGATITADVE